MSHLEFTSICKNNQIIILDGLGANDLQTGRRLFEHIDDNSRAQGRANFCTRYIIHHRSTLFAILKSILTECKAGVLMPVLHFEFHGHAEKGLRIGVSGEYVTWAELITHVSEINKATRNNTGLVLAACHSFKASELVSLDRPCPFNFVLAPTEEIPAGLMQDKLIEFYYETATTGDMGAGLKNIDERMKSFVCAEWLYRRLASFFIYQYNADCRSKIVEDIVTNKIKALGYSNRNILRKIRTDTKRNLKKPDDFYRKIARDFLHGETHISWEKFSKFTDNQKVMALLQKP